MKNREIKKVKIEYSWIFELLENDSVVIAKAIICIDIACLLV